jgi:hypothetical protein
MSSVSVILSGYRRNYSLKQQYEKIVEQSYKVKDIYFYKNDYNNNIHEFDSNTINNCKSFVGNVNLGVWSRFAFALNCKSKYVCIFDDDTIPGTKWIENCINTIQTHNGLLGTRGVIFNVNSGVNNPVFENYIEHGWKYPNEQTQKVDIVGHAWFFERDWLSAFWREIPADDIFFAGEDMHFSYSIQKYLGLNTYVPPHPHNDKEMWGSIPESAWSYGTDQHATSAFAAEEMKKYLYHLISNGFKLINQ